MACVARRPVGRASALLTALVAAVSCGAAACREAPSRPAVPPTAAPAPASQPAPTSQPAEDPDPSGEQAEGYKASESTRLPDGSELYGGELHDNLALTPLADILERPEAYADRKVKTRGIVQRVCKAMGCWMELSTGEGGPEVRAPMAGHSFFLPQTAVGKQATVEAVVVVRELTEAQKKHFESEGAKATDVGVSLEASAVAVR